MRPTAMLRSARQQQRTLDSLIIVVGIFRPWSHRVRSAVRSGKLWQFAHFCSGGNYTEELEGIGFADERQVYEPVRHLELFAEDTN